jgi:hypothetical protein
MVVVLASAAKGRPAACTPLPPVLVADLEPGAAAEEVEAADPPAEETQAGVAARLGDDARQVGRTLARTVIHEVVPRDLGWGGYLLGLGAGSWVLESHKEQIRRDVLRSAFARHSGWTDAGDQFGRSHTIEGLAAVTYISGFVARSPGWRDTGLLLAESTLVAQAGTGAINFAVSETRPERGGVIRYFHTGGSSASIHMTNAMALARVLDHQLPRYHGSNPGARAARALARVVLYGIPAVTGWERMKTDQHYAWNVLAGGGMSFYLTSATLRAYDHLRASSQLSSREPEGPAPAGERAESASPAGQPAASAARAASLAAGTPPRWLPRLAFVPAPQGKRGGALLLAWDLSSPGAPAP